MLTEPTAYAWVMERVTPEEIDELEQIKTEIQNLSKISTVKEATKLDLRFRRCIYGATQNTELSRLLERLLSNYMRFWLSTPLKIDTVSIFHNHIEIIDAIQVKNEELLRKLSINVIKRSLNGIMGSF